MVKNVVTYPADFIEETKRIFPDWPEMHGALDSGDEVVGEYLKPHMFPDPKAIKEAEGDEVLEVIKRVDDIQALFVRWVQLTQS